MQQRTILVNANVNKVVKVVKEELLQTLRV